MNYLEIEKVVGREILDSRGNPTVEAEITLVDGTVARGTLRSHILYSRIPYPISSLPIEVHSLDIHFCVRLMMHRIDISLHSAPILWQ